MAWTTLGTLSVAGAFGLADILDVSHPGVDISDQSDPPAGTSLTVDFRRTSHSLNIFSVGATISTYNGNGGIANINLSSRWRAQLGALGPMAWRIPLRYNRGDPGSSAERGRSSGDAAKYIRNIKAIGGQPVVVVGGDHATNDFTSSDAAGLVRYFNDGHGQNGGPVHAWVIGNEYTNPGNDPIGYQAHLAGWAEAMKEADPTITLSAPAAPDMSQAGPAIAETVRRAGKYIDFLSYHSYQSGQLGLRATGDYRRYAEKYAAEFITAGNFGSRRSEVHPALEEYNWAPTGGAPEFFQWENTVFAASVIGNSLSGGAHAYQYADSNGPLGLMNDGTEQRPAMPGKLFTRLPVYWGIGMWTGLNGLLRPYGSSLVETSSSVTEVEVYGTNNGKIVAINKAMSAHEVTIGLGGRSSGTYVVWQTNASAPTAPPRRVVGPSRYTQSIVTVSLPGGTVSSIEV